MYWSNLTDNSMYGDNPDSRVGKVVRVCDMNEGLQDVDGGAYRRIQPVSIRLNNIIMHRTTTGQNGRGQPAGHGKSRKSTTTFGKNNIINNNTKCTLTRFGCLFFFQRLKRR